MLLGVGGRRQKREKRQRHGRNENSRVCAPETAAEDAPRIQVDLATMHRRTGGRLHLYYTAVSEAAKPGAAEERVNILYDTRLPDLSRWRQMQIPVIAGVVSSLIAAIGPTLQFDSLGEDLLNGWFAARKACVGAFWHRCIFPAIWRERNHDIVVMNTTNFDGQWTRRVIERFGFDTSQGSSTRGGLRGLADMARKIEGGQTAAFTIDGPRGPRYVAKPGPVMLARRTGAPIYPFHIGLETAWTLEKTWDLFQIPQPFSRAIFVGGPFIWVAADADAEMVHLKHAEMQRGLERVRDVAESWFGMGAERRSVVRREWRELIAAGS
jgi:lysophospholipid acyltransferase (LPLAT)-like uncharacterized protein